MSGNVARSSRPTKKSLSKRQKIPVKVEESDSTEVSSSDEERKEAINMDKISMEYWNILELIKNIKTANYSATIVALCCLKDHDYTTQAYQLAMEKNCGVEVLLNILECNDNQCRLGSLNILSEISLNKTFRKEIVNLRGIPSLIRLLSEPTGELKLKAVETVTNVAKDHFARKLVRRHKGIQPLIKLLDIPVRCLITTWSKLNAEERKILTIAKAGAKALWALSESRHNRDLMRHFGFLALMGKLLKSIHIDIIVPIMGTVQQCAGQPSYQFVIAKEKLILDIVKHLKSQNLELKMLCCLAISHCVHDTVASDMVRDSAGLEQLVAIIKDENMRKNKHLLVAATRAVWKCAASDANMKRLDELEVIKILIHLLTHENNDVLANVVGGIAECVKFPKNREILRTSDALPLLVDFLYARHPLVLENVTKVLRECAQEPESMKILEDLEAIRLLWSLMKKPNPTVQAHAAWALCPCIENAHESGELIRSFFGAFQLVVSLLNSKDDHVLAAVCAVIAILAKDRDNLEILTDHKIIYKLAELVNTKDDFLRENLAAAIASCASCEKNSQELGRLEIVTPIVRYFASGNPKVHRTAAMALEKLSKNPQNCITMQKSGAVKFLLKSINSKDSLLQEASGGCLENIRKLALRAEKHRLGFEI